MTVSFFSIRRWALLLLILTTTQVIADYPLEIIQLQSRPVDEIMPILRPFIDKEGSIAGMNNQLIIRTSPHNVEEIHRLLQRLDRPARSVMITVRQSITDQERQRTANTDINTMLGKHSKVVVGNPHSSRDLQFRLKEARTQDHLAAIHTLQTVEGHPAFIAIGQSLPVPEQTTRIHRYTVEQQTTTRYRNIVSGFYVIPTLNGTQVTLEITPRLDRPGSAQGEHDIQQAHTVVTGKLGEWITLGGVTHPVIQNWDHLLRSTQTAGRDDRLIELLVEEIIP